MKEKTKKKKEKKLRVKKIGVHKKTVIILWLVLIVSVGFGIYKNFTAIDMHTVHERETVKETIIDTSGIENFVTDFAYTYYSWQNTQGSIDARYASLSDYMTKTLQDLNADTVKNDAPASSTVTSVKIWDISKAGKKSFDVLYSVDQSITEGETKTAVTSAYAVRVHRDDDGSLVITKNPTIASLPGKSSFEPAPVETDGTVDAETIAEATEFLKTFFALYPMATGEELSYYAEGGALSPVGCPYTFAELLEPVFTKDGKFIDVSVSVRYLDDRTKMSQISQFDLTLIKDGNWKITDKKSENGN